MNATIFAYGQTATGKTFTMRGNEMSPGLIPLSIAEVFKEVSKNKERNFKICVSFLELYNETIYDLLVENSEKLEIKENTHGVFIKGLSIFEVHSLEEAMKYLKQGDARRKIAETRLNLQSSRSHTVFRINVESKPVDALPVAPARVSQLNLVDLAGSEGVSRTKAEGIRLREGRNINKSLLALSNVIHRLSTSAGKHINFRDTKLTRMLQPALGGNAKTAIICTINTQKENYQETVNTLLFGVKAKKIQNSAKVNVVVPDTHTRYQLALKEIQKQKVELTRLREDNRALRMRVMENAASDWEVIAFDLKNAKGSEVIDERLQRFANVIEELKHINEVNKQENLALQNELNIQSANLVAADNQMLEFSKVIRSKDRELNRLREVLINSGVEYASTEVEDLKEIIIAAPEENSEQDLSMVEDYDGIQLLSIAKERSRSCKRTLNDSFGTPNARERKESEMFNSMYREGSFVYDTPKLKEHYNSNRTVLKSHEKLNIVLGKGLECAKMECKESAEAIKKLVAEKMNAVVQYELLRSKYDKLSDEFNDIFNTSQDLLRRNKELTAELEELTACSEMVSIARKEMLDKGSLISALTEQAKNMRAQIDRLNMENHSLELKVHHLSMHKCPEVEEVKGQVEEKNVIIKKLKEQHKECGRVRGQLIEELELTKKKLKDSENQLEQAKGKNATLNVKLQVVGQKNQELKEKASNRVNLSTTGKRKIFTAFKAHDYSRSKRSKGSESNKANLSFIHITRKSTIANKENTHNN